MGRGIDGTSSEFVERLPIVEMTIDADEHSWFEEVAEFLRRLDIGRGRTWRSDASERITALSRRWQKSSEEGREATLRLTAADGRMFAHIAFELVAEEDPRALAAERVTWRSIAADDLTAIADRVRRALSETE